MFRFLLITLAVVCLSSCNKAVTQSPPIKNQETKQPIPQIEPQMMEVASPKCPTNEDAQEGVSRCEKLVDEIQSIVAEAEKGKTAPEALSAHIKSGHDDISKWKETNQESIQNCDLLLGADGTQVYPEIPAAFQTLKQAGEWLEKSLVATEQKEKSAAHAYLRGAHTIADRATKILDGDLKPHVDTKIPKYIRRADEEMEKQKEGQK